MPDAALAGEPGLAILDLFDQLLRRLKSIQPSRIDDRPSGNGYKLELLPLGQPIDPGDFDNPWTPQGGAPVGGGTAGPSPATSVSEASRAMAAAFKTAILATRLADGRRLDFQYLSILDQMQASASEPADPAVAAAVKAARIVLYRPNPDGSFSVKPTAEYQAYKANAIKYGAAASAFAEAFAATRTDRAAFDAWPLASRTYQDAKDQARSDFLSQGGADVENALDTIAAVGNPIQPHLIAEARKLYAEWNLGLAGVVPAPMPYSIISPSGWADPDDKQGWTQVTVDSSSYVIKATRDSDPAWSTAASSPGGAAQTSLGFGAVRGSPADPDHRIDGRSIDYSQFTNSAKDLTISVWYALVDIERPWLVGDLFSMDGWYLKRHKRGDISSGVAVGPAETATPSLPAIPTRMLVVKDVRIDSRAWGVDGSALQTLYGRHQNEASVADIGVPRPVELCLGPLSFGGSPNNASAARGDHFEAKDASEYFATTFDGQTLRIPGAQIVAWLSEIVPLCPPLDDPGVAALDPAPASSAVSVRIGAVGNIQQGGS